MGKAMKSAAVIQNKAAYHRGRVDGFPLGWKDGHWFGRCESVVRRATPVPVKRPLHVLYVTSGKGFPYSPLDHGIVETLKTVAERVTLVVPDEDVLKVATKVRPDMMLVLDGMHMAPEKVQAVNALGVRTAIWFTDDPYYTDITAGIAVHYHHVFTLEKNCLSFYAERGCPRVSYLPLGVFPVDYRPRNTPFELRGEISFIGTAYWNRVTLFDQLMPLLAHRRLHLSGLWWDRLAEYERWKGIIDLGKWMEPGETSERYNANKIVINSHRAHDDGTFNQNRAMITAVSPNPRTFEISASATMQLTDYREDIAQFYIPGQEIVTYDSPEDLAAKTDYYLEHEEERQEIALRGLYRTLRDHTFVSRLNQIMDLTMNG
ncbi:CgeB family protein [Cohnella abietis]|uniref:Spore maturation protein n=1 Tax=Cohnella abietis TaxID=2507935 RepID=A0A3T1DA89_9BACL|nr:glycosyltransferase [Cohnella abietis]BBI35011.1 spore maturation protein [Cohnella abietis]